MATSNQKMREALKQIYDYAWAHGVWEIESMAKAALAAPPRNCDVGTADEQARRLDIYCSMHGKDESGCYRCEKCKFMRVDRCELAWAQMPYEEGGAE